MKGSPPLCTLLLFTGGYAHVISALMYCLCLLCAVEALRFCLFAETRVYYLLISCQDDLTSCGIMTGPVHFICALVCMTDVRDKMTSVITQVMPFP